MNDNGIKFEVVITNKSDNKNTTTTHDNIKSAAAIYAKSYLKMEESVKLYVVLGHFKFEYLHDIKRFRCENKVFLIYWEGYIEPYYFTDVNLVLDKIQYLVNLGKDKIVVAIRDTSDDTPIVTDYVGKSGSRELLPYQKRILGDTKNQTPSGKEDNPLDEGKPEREKIIQKDEITNLKISLNIEMDVNDFLNKI
jgi:hypothetical protein